MRTISIFIKKYHLIAVFIGTLALLSIAYNAFATSANLTTNTDRTIACTTFNAGQNCAIHYQSNGVQFLGTGISGTATNISIYYNTNEYSVNTTIIQCDTPNLSTYPSTCTGYNATTITHPSGWLQGTGWLNLPANYTFNPAKYYYLVPSFNNLGTGYNELPDLGILPSGYSTAFYWRDQNYGDSLTGFTLSFAITGVTGAPQSSITFNYPYSYTAVDPALFNVAYENNADTIANTDIQVRYSQNADVSAPFFADTIFNTNASSTALQITKTNALTAGTWYAQATLYNSTSTYSFLDTDAVATTTVLNWNIGATPTSTIISSCDTQTGTVEHAVCVSLDFLFTPSSAVLLRYTDLKNDIQDKPPFGYWGAVSTAFNNISASTTPEYIIDTTNITLFAQLKTALGYILWLLFIVWLINRLRHLQL